jgi:hypothetical protein
MKRIIISMLFLSVIVGCDIVAAARKTASAAGVVVDPQALLGKLKEVQGHAAQLSQAVVLGSGVKAARSEADLVEQFFTLLGGLQESYVTLPEAAQLKAIAKEAKELRSMGFVSSDFVADKTSEILKLLSGVEAIDDVREAVEEAAHESPVAIVDQIFAIIETAVAEKKATGKGLEKSYSAAQIRMFVQSVEQLLPLFDAMKTELRKVHIRKIDVHIRTLKLLQISRGKVTAVQQDQADGVLEALKSIKKILTDAQKMPFFSPTRGLNDGAGDDDGLPAAGMGIKTKLFLATWALFQAVTLWQLWACKYV